MPETPPSQQNQNQESEQYLFYNVMPKEKSENTIVQPKLSVVDTPQPLVNSDSKPGSFKRLLKYFFILILLILLAGGGYVAYNKFIKNGYKPQDLLGSRFAKDTPPAENETTNATTTSQITGDWQTQYFGNSTCKEQATCGDTSDPDRDGLQNLEEFKAGIDPNNADSDTDGLSDGDEAKVFFTSPSNSHSGINPKYSDTDSLKGGYDPKTDKKYTVEAITAIYNRIKELGLHQPTIKTLGEALTKIYHFDGSPIATTTPVSIQITTSTPINTSSSTLTGVDQSAKAKQDRDAQRSTTIQNIGIALLKYQSINKVFPAQANFDSMYAEVKSYNLIATNPVDPINKDPYLYGYEQLTNGTDFTLSFYSETQNQLIKVHSSDAQKYVNDQKAATNDDQRKTDLESIQSALLLYSNENAAGNQDYVFPIISKLKTEVVPKYLSSLPKDPQTGNDYEYQVSETFNSFTLKAILQAPPTGNTGYLCNQDECRYY